MTRVDRPTATIEALLLPEDAADFYASPVETLEFDLQDNGIVGDTRHRGTTTLADVRAPAYPKKQVEMLNRQSVSFVGADDLDYIAQQLHLDPYVLFRAEAARAADGLTHEFDRMVADIYEHDDAARITRRFLASCLGANLMLGRLILPEDGSELPFRDLQPGLDFGPFDATSLQFGKGDAEDGATVMITRPNSPCIDPGKKIEALYPQQGLDLAKRFVVAAQGRRGFVGMVVKGGKMTVGQAVRFVPFGER